ncbi:hypothetical protein [Silvanigrella sp.]|jgi:hypothetical protein|uniref:hypothetical protein n=1 Tax=Silvanigrella sp. TaxID=2024976 RepID=UPI0037C945FA
MSVIAFNLSFYFTATALLIQDDEEFRLPCIKLVNQLAESNWGAYSERYNENMSIHIEELNKILISLNSGNSYKQYLKPDLIDRFLKELRMFEYNSDENPRIYKTLYSLYNKALRKKEYWENSKNIL